MKSQVQFLFILLFFNCFIPNNSNAQKEVIDYKDDPIIIFESEKNVEKEVNRNSKTRDILWEPNSIEWGQNRSISSASHPLYTSSDSKYLRASEKATAIQEYNKILQEFSKLEKIKEEKSKPIIIKNPLSSKDKSILSKELSFDRSNVEVELTQTSIDGLKTLKDYFIRGQIMEVIVGAGIIYEIVNAVTSYSGLISIPKTEWGVFGNALRKSNTISTGASKKHAGQMILEHRKMLKKASTYKERVRINNNLRFWRNIYETL